MMKNNKKISKKVYDQLLDNEAQLKNYLAYIRHKQAPNSKIVIDSSISGLNKKISITGNHGNNKYSHSYNNNLILGNPSNNKSNQVYIYVQKYLKTLKEVMTLQSYSSKKILKKTLEFLEQFPSMNFLYEVVNSFGKDQKKLTMNQNMILSYAVDQMVPLFQKIIQKIESLRKQSESKKLMELGHRIQHLQTMVETSKGHVVPIGNTDQDMGKIFKKVDADRVEKYLVMEDNILKAEKRFGDFSQNFIKNREVFSNLNRVYQNIKKQQK